MKSNLRINVIINFIYEIILIITPFITAPYVSRVLGSSGIGVASYSKSLVTYFTMFASLGVATYGKREIGRKRDDKDGYSQAFWEIELLITISSLICLLVWLCFSFVYSDYTSYLLILSFNIVSVVLNISWLFFGLEKYLYTVSVNIVFKIIDVIAIFVFVKGSNGVIIYVAISSASLLLSNLSMWIFAPKVLKTAKPKIKMLRHHLKETWVYFIPTISTTLYMVLDKTLIGIICNNSSENGYYEQATNITNMIRVVAYSSIHSVMNSRANYLYKNDKQSDIKDLSNNSFNVTLFLSVGACFGLIGVSSSFIPIFLGNDFDKTILLLYVLAPIIPIMSLSDGLGALYYTPSGRRKESTKYLIIGFLINIVLNIALIPFLGAIGAAISSLIGETVISFLYIAKSKGFLTIKSIIKNIWKKMIAGFILLLSCVFIKLFFGNIIDNMLFILVIQIFSGFLIYVLILFLLKDNCFKTVKLILKRK